MIHVHVRWRYMYMYITFHLCQKTVHPCTSIQALMKLNYRYRVLIIIIIVLFLLSLYKGRDSHKPVRQCHLHACSHFFMCICRFRFRLNSLPQEQMFFFPRCFDSTWLLQSALTLNVCEQQGHTKRFFPSIIAAVVLQSKF